MPDDDPSKNPFVRWKHLVDAHVSATLHGLLGLPAIVSENLNLNTRAADVDNSSADPEQTAQANSEIERAVASRLRQRPARMDLLQSFAWSSFLFQSPYSPLNLQGLPQPVPNDAPRHGEGQDFTFMDAFEDLLEETASGRLPDLPDRLRSPEEHQVLSRIIRQEHFLQRMMSLDKRHINAYLPLPPAGQSVDDSEQAASIFGEEQDDWRVEARNRLRDIAAAQQPTFNWPGTLDSPAGLFDQFNSVFSVLNKVLEEEERRPQDPSKADGRLKESSKEDGVASKNQDRFLDAEPDTEDEFYKIVKSVYTDADRSFSTFVKAISDINTRTGVSTSFSKSVDRFDGTDDAAIQTFKDTKEHTDRFGNLHVKTTIRRVNADGEEVARETHYSVRSASQVSGDDEEKSDHVPQEKGGGEVEQQQQSGWFWK
ncbi:uncharacterized protein E0L32_012325 [Thyridium curvatum]|uniref:Uncharacterized protein n=1 Tax=Thyridium curvatum TaxID=1093900 RepID=A0A507B1N5_9PEZI|nr:uncharacterized protein E0L32_012325 [Thyridium curvatum]TPX17015.1 hypothetical protein E0L32_012325 [Thyridium curvatum]